MPITPDSQLKRWVDITPAQGIDAEDPSSGMLTEDTFVSDSENFEFHHGAAFSRPGITAITFKPVFETIVGGAADQDAWSPLASGTRSYGNFASTNINTIARKGATIRSFNFLWTGVSEWTVAENLENPVGAPHPLPDPATVRSFDYVNGDLYIASINSKILRIANAAGLYELVTDTDKWENIVSHRARLIGARSVAAPQSVGWSVSGNALSWNVYGGNSVGTALADSIDSVVGLANIRNVIVVFHANGISLLNPTRQANIAYDNERFEKNGIGVYHIDTLASSRSVAFFVAEDNVYSFDLNNITPIGTKAGRGITDLCYGAFSTTRGFICHNVGRRRSSYYIIYEPGQNPAWFYNIQHNTWTKFTFDSPVSHFSNAPTAFKGVQIRSLVGNSPGTQWPLSGLSNAFWVMHNDKACERAMWLRSRTFTLGTPMEEWRCTRAIIVHTTVTSVVMTITLTARNAATGAVSTNSTPTTTANTTTKPDRLVVNFPNPISGNYYDVRLDYPASTDVTVFKIMLEFDRVGGPRAS